MLNTAKATYEMFGLDVADCTQRLGEVLVAQGQYEEAAKTLTAAMASFEKIGDLLSWANCAGNVGNVLGLQGHYQEAMDLLKHATSVFDKRGDPLGAANCRGTLGDSLLM
ncbi:hypothetical protein CALCODRAFT_484284 [Calocera cornea HHB12733]|uniref:Uncharacterized protein n=1 Tax=Calocera cornea HHB12733 TaxID=1353952 RepID=A0A165F2U8_9BASI|nr:hypothetical protein CALCODRAFT_484284 [Calocera cornea HHB12733]